jgi:hypothetical protein
MDAGFLTAVRTGAASGVATKYLARQGTSAVVYGVSKKSASFWQKIFGNAHSVFWTIFLSVPYTGIGDKNLTIQQLIQEQRRRLLLSNPVERLAAALLIPAALRRQLNKLEDRSLAELLNDEVGAHLSAFGPELTICDEAMRRRRRRGNASPERTRIWMQRRAGRSFAAERDEGVPVMHAESALYGAGIPHILLPFQRSRFASNIFMVPCVPDAKACLCRAGFLETHGSPTMLIHKQTRRPIRLYEDRTQLYSTSEEGLGR